MEILVKYGNFGQIWKIYKKIWKDRCKIPIVKFDIVKKDGVKFDKISKIQDFKQIIFTKKSKFQKNNVKKSKLQKLKVKNSIFW